MTKLMRVLFLKMAFITLGCDAIPTQNAAESGAKTVYGETENGQGFMLSLPEPEKPYSHVRVEIWQGPAVIEDEYCGSNTTPGNPGQPPVPDPSDGFGLSQPKDEPSTPPPYHPNPGPNPPVYISFDIPFGTGEREVRLPVGHYSIVMSVVDFDGRTTHRGHDVFGVKARTFTELQLTLKRVDNGCQGGVVISYVLEADGPGNPDEPDDPKEVVDVCELIASLKAPRCGSDEYQPTMCSIPAFLDRPSIIGSRARCEEEAKYHLLKEICKSQGSIYKEQLAQLKCN